MHKIKKIKKLYMQKITRKKKKQWQYVFACVLFAYEVEVIYTTFNSNSHGNNKQQTSETTCFFYGNLE